MDGAPDHDRHRDDHKILENILSFQGEHEGYSDKNLIGKQQNRGCRPDHVQEQHHRRQTKNPATQQSETNDDLEGTENRHTKLWTDDSEAHDLYRRSCKGFGGTQSGKQF